jgi:translation initiation factor IF-2
MRLSKIAKELIVGIGNIVDHLASKGIKIDGRPNTKITLDAYELLKQQFSDDVEQHKRSAEVAEARRQEKQAIKDAAIKKSDGLIKAKATFVGPKRLGKIDVSSSSKISGQEKPPSVDLETGSKREIKEYFFR